MEFSDKWRRVTDVGREIGGRLGVGVVRGDTIGMGMHLGDLLCWMEELPKEIGYMI